MITKNHECYVSLEVAKLLKKAGFDWKVDTLYFSMQDDDYLIKEELIKCTDYFPNGGQRGTGNIFHNWNQLNTKRGDYYAFVSKKNFLEFDYEIIKKDTTLISAPTLDVTQRWLREVKGIEVYAHVFYDTYDTSEGWDVYVYEVNHIAKQTEDWINSYDVYHSYEEAQEAGIKKVLEIILEK